MEKDDVNKNSSPDIDLNADNETAKSLKSNETSKPAPRKNENHDASQNDETDKYLAREQPGVTYTPDSDFKLSDTDSKLNSDAFSQDEDVLSDNVDLDEDQNQSISSDDDDFEELNEKY